MKFLASKVYSDEDMSIKRVADLVPGDMFCLFARGEPDNRVLRLCVYVGPSRLSKSPVEFVPLKDLLDIHCVVTEFNRLENIMGVHKTTGVEVHSR